MKVLLAAAALISLSALADQQVPISQTKSFILYLYNEESFTDKVPVVAKGGHQTIAVRGGRANCEYSGGGAGSRDDYYWTGITSANLRDQFGNLLRSFNKTSGDANTLAAEYDLTKDATYVLEIAGTAANHGCPQAKLISATYVVFLP